MLLTPPAPACLVTDAPAWPKRGGGAAVAAVLVAATLGGGTQAWAGDRLLGTSGVTQLEGAAGGGLTPWAVVAGSGSSNQVGGSLFSTAVHTRGGYELSVAGGAIGVHDRVEISMARWSFKLGDVMPGKSIEMNVAGIKARVAGDAVYDQDRWMPQLSVGAQYKANDDAALLRQLGAARASDVDVYVSATKLWLGAAGGYNLLANLTLRLTRANQFGLVGFGSAADDRRRLQPEGSLAVMPRDDLAVGVEYRAKPNNLESAASILREEAAWDAFVAWFPSRWVSITAAWVNLGNVVGKPGQSGWYMSGQLTY